jgi:hypothetical protein
MRSLLLRLIGGGAAAAFLAACGLALSGLEEAAGDAGTLPSGDGGNGFFDAPLSASDDGSPEPSEAGEGGIGTDNDARVVTVTPCEAGTVGCYVIPTGWSLVAFAPNQSAACPSGFAIAAPTNLVEAPNASSACTCGTCTVSAPPTCANGAITSSFDVNNPIGTNTCATAGGTMNNNPPGACDTDVYTGNFDGLDLKFIPPTAADGQCATPGEATGTVSYGAEARACQPDSPAAAGCTGDTCTPPEIAAPYAACIVRGGAVACPGGPFSVQHVVGTSATVNCTACNCTVSADCSGNVELFTDTACMNGELVIAADAGCHPGAPAGILATTFGSYKYVANAPTNVACASSGSSTGSATLTHEQTICCAPSQ